MICIFRFSFVYVSLFQLEYEDGLGNFLMLLFRIIVVYRPIRMVVLVVIKDYDSVLDAV